MLTPAETIAILEAQAEAIQNVLRELTPAGDGAVAVARTHLRQAEASVRREVARLARQEAYRSARERAYATPQEASASPAVPGGGPPRAAYGITEVAASLGVSAKHIRNAVANGELIAVRLGRRILIRQRDLEAWLAAATIAERRRR